MTIEASDNATSPPRGGAAPGEVHSLAMAGVGRTSLLLTPAQIGFLDRFCARVRRDTGGYLSRARIIAVLVNALAESRVSLAEVHSETHLKEALHGQRLPGPPDAASRTAEP